MPVDVVNFIVSQRNPYNELLYGGADRRYRMRPGTIDDALAGMESGGSSLFHLHWEERLLVEHRERDVAAAVMAAFEQRLDTFLARGGRLVWTIHNALPHEPSHLDLFLTLRRRLAERAALILVHHEAAAETLAGQCAVDRSKLQLLPHPAYFGAYESEAETRVREPDWQSRRLMTFGMLRPYKGFDLLAEAAALAPDIGLDVIGEPGPRFAAEVAPVLARTPSIAVSPNRVEDADLPALMRRVRGLVLPYRALLGSGVALLAMTFGRPIVAPDVRQVRDLLPFAALRFLYRPRDAGSLAARMRDLVALGEDQQRQLRRDLQGAALRFHPERVGARLFALLDAVSR